VHAVRDEAAFIDAGSDAVEKLGCESHTTILARVLRGGTNSAGLRARYLEARARHPKRNSAIL
jgi:hypothetical protein